MTAFHSLAPGQQTPDSGVTGITAAHGQQGKAVPGGVVTIHAASTFATPAQNSPTPPTGAAADMVPAEFFQNAVIHAGIPVVSLDAMGRIISWNAAAVLLFGRSEADALGRPLESLIPPEFRAAAGGAFQRTVQQRSVNAYEMTILPEGGHGPIHVGVTLSCVTDVSGSAGGGTLKGVMAWMRNISNRKELEDHLVRTSHMANIGTLAAGVAHHFNNIACGMGTMVDFALATEDRGAMLKALRMAAEACTRISYITQGLLACSGDPAEGERDLSDLTEEILRFADAVEPTLNQRGISLELDLMAHRIAAVPRLRFGQALQHLLRNAEDAIAERSAMMIGAQQRITIRTVSQGDQIMLQFADTGCGMESEDLPHIFDPFFTKKGVQGGGNRNNPGLGLTLVRTVITEMGGHIWADSTPGQGATLNMVIPIIT